jgi:imidazoleglycerol phosphate synthase glutamine amidotransferase subunit HisH
MVRAGRVLGMQFHPEKSSRDGLRLLHAAIAEAGS